MPEKGADRGQVADPGRSFKVFHAGADDVPMVERLRPKAVIFDNSVLPIGIEDQIRKASFAHAQVPAHPIGLVQSVLPGSIAR